LPTVLIVILGVVGHDSRVWVKGFLKRSEWKLINKECRDCTGSSWDVPEGTFGAIHSHTKTYSGCGFYRKLWGLSCWWLWVQVFGYLTTQNMFLHACARHSLLFCRD
jgi:hypothetical protein